MDSTPSLAEQHWRSRAGTIARRVNFGWWWHALTSGLVVLNLAAAITLVLFRQLRWPLEIWASLLILSWLGAGIWALRKARPRFYSTTEGLLRLETHLGWHNVLSSAAAGGIKWPSFPAESLKALEWSWGPSVRPMLISLAFLLLGWVLPVGGPPKPALPPPGQLPVAIQQVDKWTQVIKEQKLVEPAMMQTLEERLEQLKKKPAQEWYGQESLEAADSLRNQMAQEIDTMGKNLKKASDLLTDLQSLPSGSSALGEFDAALSQQLANLQNSNLPLSQGLAQSLSNAKQLTPQQLADLIKQLSQGAQSMQAMLPNWLDPPPSSGTPGQAGQPGQSGQPGQGQGQGQGQGTGQGQGQGSGQGQGQGTGQGGNGNSPGQSGDHGNGTSNGVGSGGPGGGGGAAGISYNSAPTDVKTGKQEGIANNNITAPTPGDTVSISKSAPPKDPQGGDTSTQGGAASSGSGGDAVWRQELTPEERTLLQQYFK